MLSDAARQALWDAMWRELLDKAARRLAAERKNAQASLERKEGSEQP
jgi:hypothetical protein